MSILPHNKYLSKLLPFSYLASVLIIAIVLILLNNERISHYLSIRQEKTRQKEIVYDFEQKIKDKQKEKEKLITSKFENERIGRDQLNMRLEPERLFNAGDQESTPTLKLK